MIDEYVYVGCVPLHRYVRVLYGMLWYRFKDKAMNILPLFFLEDNIEPLLIKL